MLKHCRVAVLGASGLVGAAIVKELEERNFPVSELLPLASARSLGKSLEFRGRHLQVAALEDCDFTNIDLAFFAADAASAWAAAPRATAQGALVIDSSTAFHNADDVPLVVAGANAAALAGLGQRRLVATPQASSVLLLTVLKPIAEAAGLERVHVATYQSVSGAGSAAIEELAQQSGQLLNGRAPVKPKFFARQIAFNCLPQVDELQPSGHTRAELALAQDARRILGIPDLGVTATAVYVPVFHGDALAVHIETTRKLNAAETRTLLTKTPGITVFENPSKGGYPTAALDAANQDTVFVGRIREDISQERGLNLWTVSDNTRQGAASNSVRIAEILVRDYL